MLAHFSFEMSFQTLAVCYILTRYTHTHHVPHAEHMFTGQQAKWIIGFCTAMPCCPLPISFTGQQAKWISQVLMCKSSPVPCYPVFHPLVKQLPSFISLDSFSSLPSPSILRDHEWHVPERYVNYAKTCIFQSWTCYGQTYIHTSTTSD